MLVFSIFICLQTCLIQRQFATGDAGIESPPISPLRTARSVPNLYVPPSLYTGNVSHGMNIHAQSKLVPDRSFHRRRRTSIGERLHERDRSTNKRK